MLAKLFADATREQETDDGVPEWAVGHRNKNLWGLLAIVQLFLVKGGISTPVNQAMFWQSGVMEQVLRTAFSQNFNVKIRTKVSCANSMKPVRCTH